MPKASTAVPGRPARRHNPLEADIVATGVLRTNSAKKRARDRRESDGEHHFVDSKASSKILRIGRELDEEEAGATSHTAPTPADSFGYSSRFGDDAEEANQSYDDDEEEAWDDDEADAAEDVEIDPTDLETYRKFMPDEEDDLLKHGWDRQPSHGAEEGETTNLADLILAKIAVHEAGGAKATRAPAPEDPFELAPKVVDVYTK